MITYKTYGGPPYKMILLHGGPGAIHDLHEVARELSKEMGIIAIINRGKSIEEQIGEILEAYKATGTQSATVAGHSWGAWLGLLFANQHPSLVKNLMLISCPSFDQKDREVTTFTRLKRLNEKQRTELEKLSLRIRQKASPEEKNASFRVLGNIIKTADTFHPLKDEKNGTTDYEVFRNIWPQADELRRNGIFLEILHTGNTPVTAIHGDYDPHPAEAVKTDLAQAACKTQFHLLKKCGHYPWNEKYARDEFFQLLRENIR